MTKNTGIKISIIIAAVLFIGASKPSLDGRALVASPGELPPGLYVKTAAFLPGDTVLITNPAAKVSVEALVFGTFSPSEGVAVLLSPEAAALLFISKDSNSIVQLTKNGRDTERSVLAKAFDEAVSPQSAEETQDDSVLYADYVKAEAVQEDSSPVQTSVLPEIPAETETQSQAGDAVVSENAVVSADEEVIAQSEVVVPEDLSEEEEEAVFTPFADAEEGEKKEEKKAEPFEDTRQEGYASESVYDEPPVETAETEVTATQVSDDIVFTADDSLVEETANEAEQSLYAADEAAEPDTSEPEPEPNILVTTEDNPPVFEQEAESVIVDVSDTAHDMLPDYFMQPQEDDVSFAEKPVYGESVYPDTEMYIIDSISALGEGSYCIQLATYKNQSYIVDIIEKYADKYPVRLLKSEKIPDAYQVLIGPLNKDEYPVILKRFIARGFKDAFLRTVR